MRLEVQLAGYQVDDFQIPRSLFYAEELGLPFHRKNFIELYSYWQN